MYTVVSKLYTMVPESLSRDQLCEEDIKSRFYKQNTIQKITKTICRNEYKMTGMTPIDSRMLMSGLREVR